MFNREKQEMKRVPMMPVRDMVIFPQQMTPFIVGREASVRALEEALAGDKKIFLSTQHDASVDDPKPEEIYAVGTLANIVQSVKLPDGNIKVLVEGVERARAISIATEEGFFRATVRLLGARVEPSPQVEQTVQKITGLYEQFIKLSQSLNYDTMIAAARVDDPARLSDTIAANLQLPVDEKQDLLETVDPLERLNRIGDILEIELEKLNVDRNINTRVKRQMERAQKDYYRRHEQGSPREGHPGAEAPGIDAPDVRGIHRQPQLSRLAARSTLEKALQRNPRHQSRRKNSQRRALRPGQSQRAHPRIPGCAPARKKSEGLHPVLRRTSGRRQDVACHVHRSRHRPQIRPRFARRRAR